MKNILLSGLVLVFLTSMVVAGQTQSFGNIQRSLEDLCRNVKGLIPIVSFLLIVMAGVIYAIGQVMGAETRARASVWATAMLIGAIIGILIVVIAPPVLQQMYGGTTQFNC